METTQSKDGTSIAFEQVGQGPPVVLVMGAFNDRKTGSALAAALATHFTVICYDRRGRGDSGDGAEYSVQREVEDLDALIRATSGNAAVFGYSSGAALALAAAANGVPITRLALFELPPAQPPEHARELAALIAQGRRGDAVEYFQRRVVGIPEEVVVGLRHAPFRPALEAMAHTVVYDATVTSRDHLTAELFARVRPPTLAIAGSASPPVMREVAETLAPSLPNGRALVVEGATHDLEPALLVPVLQGFLS